VPDPADMTAAFAAAVAGRRAVADAAASSAAAAASAAAARYGEYAAAVEKAEQRHRQLSRAVDSGAYQRQLSAVTALNRQYDQMATKAANQVRAADLASGAFMRQAAAMAAVSRETARLNQLERAQTLVAERGRFGAFHEMARPHLQTLGMAAGVGAGATMGMVRSGFSGTAEWAAFSYQWERLNRQLAAIAIPVFERIGKVVGQVASWFEGLTGRQQDQIMKIGLLTVGLVSVAGMAKLAAAALFALTGTARAAALAFAAGSAGGAVGAVGAAGTAGAAAAASGAGRGRLLFGGGVVAGSVASELGFDTTDAALLAGGAGAAFGAAKLGLSGGRVGIGAGLKTMARTAGRAYLPLGVGLSGMEAYSMFEARRAAGESTLGAGARSLAHGAVDFASFGLIDLYDRPGGGDAAKKAEEKRRRDVTPMGTGLLEAGGTAQLIQEKLLEATVRRMEDREELTTTIAGLVGPVERIARIVEERGGDDEGIRRLMRLAER